MLDDVAKEAYVQHHCHIFPYGGLELVEKGLQTFLGDWVWGWALFVSLCAQH